MYCFPLTDHPFIGGADVTVKKIPTTIKIILLNKIDGSSANKVALGSNLGEAENPAGAI
jgi:hypothetical protein